MPLDADVPGPHADKSSRDTAHGGLESILDWGKRFGFAFELPERLLAWWKFIGFRRAFVVLLVITIPVLKYEWLPEGASGALTGLASAYGINLKVGEWSGDLYDLKATAHDVTIETHGQYAESALLHADAVVWISDCGAASAPATGFSKSRLKDPGCTSSTRCRADGTGKM